MINDTQEQVLGNIFDNTTAVLQFNRDNYYLLIKKQKNKNYCTLFLTDCTKNFWIEKIDLPFCQELKRQIKLKSDIKSFASHFVTGLKETAKILSVAPNPTIKVCMKISEGLIINASLKIELCINKTEKLEDFQKLMKNFFQQLFEAKDAQMKKLQQKYQTEDKKEVKKEDPEFIKSVLSLQEKKQAPAPKNRDLINPYKKKRKNQGIKIGPEV